MHPFHEMMMARAQNVTRRHFLRSCQLGLGTLALSQLLSGDASAIDDPPTGRDDHPNSLKKPMHKPRAKNVIYLHMAGSPPQQETFDYKPELAKRDREECPQEFIAGKKFAFIKGHPKLLGPVHQFVKQGETGQWISDQLPHLTKHIDDLCVVKSLYTDQFNHAPAQLMLHTGTPQFGGASFGAWATYGLGSENENLPGYIVMVSGGTQPSAGKNLWGSSYLPSVYQGVQCRSEGDPILFVNNPEGMSRKIRRKSLDVLNRLNRKELEEYRDQETLTRINQYELAFRMQVSVPEVMDISKETKSTLDAYGATPEKGSFANNCLLARRLVEQGVRFVQLFDWGWDIHGTGKHDDLNTQFPKKCQETDRPIAALLADLKERGMLDDTLVIWGGEFGRTPMVEARNGSKLLGRDHHPDCFTMWLAGGGMKPGSHGATDELGYKAVENPIFVSDFQATVLHALGLDPHKLSFPFQGLNQRLIGPANTPKVRDELFA
ncbi:MAG: DUF1501 domain-containing protein [Planctomycetota bacterium]